MSAAQQLIDAWGERRYGIPGRYQLAVEADHSSCPTCGYGEFSGIRVYFNGEEIAEMENVDFAALLNEILGVQP